MPFPLSKNALVCVGNCPAGMPAELIALPRIKNESFEIRFNLGARKNYAQHCHVLNPEPARKYTVATRPL